MVQVEKCSWERGQSVRLHGKLFVPDGAMNALVIMVHGVGTYGGCFDEWAETFAAQSIGFLAFDLRGHGQSSGIRGHAALRWIKDDIRVIIKSIREKFPHIPIVLFGHSMGGNIALSYVLEKDVELQGAIASAPWLLLARPPSPLLVRIAKWMSYIAPWLTVRTGISADQLSHDGVGVKSSKVDPLIHKKISVKLFSDLWKSGLDMLNNERKPNIPILLMHGTDDTLTSFQASQLFAQNAGEYVTFKEWHEMRHDLLNESCKDVVFQYIMKWMSQKIIQDGTV